MFCTIWFLIDRDDWWSKLAEILVRFKSSTILNPPTDCIFSPGCLCSYLTHISNQLPQCHSLSMVAGGMKHTWMIYGRVSILPLSMCFNIYILLFWLAHLFLHKKELSGQQQLQSKFSWHLSGLPWHTKYKGFSVMECPAGFPTWERQLVYCMCFTAMEHCYSYRESKTRYYWSTWWPVYPVSWVSIDYKTNGPKLILFKVLSCLEATSYLNLYDAISVILD